MDLFRSRPTEIRSELAHSYLENTFLRWSEQTVARILQERPWLEGRMRDRLHEMEGAFISGYHPRVFIESATTLRRLETGLTQRLLDAADRQFVEEFKPDERLRLLQSSREAFMRALDAWRNYSTRMGHDAKSAAHWTTLQVAATALHGVLSDKELRFRWIP